VARGGRESHDDPTWHCPIIAQEVWYVTYVAGAYGDVMAWEERRG
jgi:hypothetical protein